MEVAPIDHHHRRSIGGSGTGTMKARGDGMLKIGRKLGIGTSVVQRVFKQERVPS
ncbi:hypothetical protein [Bradyrhizobium sp. URHD0069]|uniref:hypothetical protein n=1 Tax=Bradyrhizobium sp. URHD0069 TaxID=1380355 RepID=UPI0012DF9B57|nr:hypothetical protein [Bradyrhizobium sp. URHD0069]